MAGRRTGARSGRCGARWRLNGNDWWRKAHATAPRGGEPKIYSRAAEEARNRQRNAAVRAKRDALRARKQRDAAERERKLRERYEREAATEQAPAAQAEAIIANMEMEERALIERLRQTQEMQREAYDDLQTTLETS